MIGVYGTIGSGSYFSKVSFLSSEGVVRDVPYDEISVVVIDLIRGRTVTLSLLMSLMPISL